MSDADADAVLDPAIDCPGAVADAADFEGRRNVAAAADCAGLAELADPLVEVVEADVLLAIGVGFAEPSAPSPSRILEYTEGSCRFRSRVRGDAASGVVGVSGLPRRRVGEA